MSLPSLIIIAEICVLRPSIVIVPLAWRVASWLHVLFPSVIGMFLSIIVTWKLFCCVHISSINVVLAPVSVNASLTARLPHGSFQIAGRVISLPRPRLRPFPGLVCFPILGLQGYSLFLRSGNCNKYVRLSYTESISCFPSSYPLSASYPVPWGPSCVPYVARLVGAIPCLSLPAKYMLFLTSCLQSIILARCKNSSTVSFPSCFLVI